MTSRDSKCVFVADDVAHATVVANWLETQSIPAKVMDSMTLGGLDGLTAWTGVSARGIEVWVRQTDDVERALTLIEEHEEFQANLEDRGVVSRPVLAFCEKCGTTTEFPSEQRETTQECPQCGASMDVSEGDIGDEEPASGYAQHDRKFELRQLKKPIILIVLGCVGVYFCILALVSLLSVFSGS